jgi:hypothetical protein
MAAALLALAAGGARGEEAKGRILTLECIAPHTPSPRGTPVLVRCRVLGQDAAPRTAVALIDPFTPPYWETMDPFATAIPVSISEPFWEARSTLVDPFEPSAVDLRDPFAPSEADVSDEP